MFRTAKAQSGFSLLELMITLAISAILLGAALPSMQSILGGSEMTTTSNALVYSLQTARSEAIKRAGPVGLCPSTAPQAEDATCSGDSYANGWIIFADSDGDGQRGSADELVLQSEARPHFTFTADTAFSERVYFSASGTSVSTAGIPLAGDIVIEKSAGDESRTVRIYANGRISTVSDAS